MVTIVSDASYTYKLVFINHKILNVPDKEGVTTRDATLVITNTVKDLIIEMES